MDCRWNVSLWSFTSHASQSVLVSITASPAPGYASAPRGLDLYVLLDATGRGTYTGTISFEHPFMLQAKVVLDGQTIAQSSPIRCDTHAPSLVMHTNSTRSCDRWYVQVKDFTQYAGTTVQVRITRGSPPSALTFDVPLHADGSGQTPEYITVGFETFPFEMKAELVVNGSTVATSNVILCTGYIEG